MFCNDWEAYCPFKPYSDPVRWDPVNSDDCPPRPTRIPLFSSLALSREVSQPLQQPGGCSSKINDECDDVVLNAGGPIWALDWCPQPSPDKKHYVAVSAHPTGASTHRMGEPVSGKNIIQLWAVALPSSSSSSSSSHVPQDSAQQLVLLSPSRDGDVDDDDDDDDEEEEEEEGTGGQSARASSKRRRKGAPFSSSSSYPSKGATRQEARSRAMGHKGEEEGQEEEEEEGPGVRVEVGAVHMVLGLAHDAGLAWDLKWRPISGGDGGGEGLGQLAVAMGDASVSVFDVPDPATTTTTTIAHTHRATAAHRDDDDDAAAAAADATPCIVRVRPSFVGVVLGVGVGDNTTGVGEASSRRSMALALQWCPSAPHNRLIAVCHDGTAALFLVPPPNHHHPRGEGSAEEGSRCEHPLVQFNVNSMPLRAVAWAPPGCGREVEENVVAMCGNGQRVYLWDVRDPFQALASVVLGGELLVTQLAWMHHPRSLLAVTDDGNIRLLCLDREVMASEEQPVGAVAPYRSGIAHYGCHGSPLWDLSLSQQFGLVAYGGVDGQVLWFQINPKPIMKGKNNPSRDKVSHYLCGGFALDASQAPPSGERCIVLIRGKASQSRSRMPNNSSTPLAPPAAGGQEGAQAPASGTGAQTSTFIHTHLPPGPTPPQFQPHPFV